MLPYNDRSAVRRVLARFNIHADDLISISGSRKEYLVSQLDIVGEKQTIDTISSKARSPQLQASSLDNVSSSMIYQPSVNLPQSPSTPSQRPRKKPSSLSARTQITGRRSQVHATPSSTSSKITYPWIYPSLSTSTCSSRWHHVNTPFPPRRPLTPTTPTSPQTTTP